MARYEFRCRECGSTFEVDRPMQRSSEPADCPDGHSDTVKLLSAVSIGGRARTATRPVTSPAPMGGGGCCGGGCGCG
jgi:putative FmdB family regulatory protein